MTRAPQAHQISRVVVLAICFAKCMVDWGACTCPVNTSEGVEWNKKYCILQHRNGKGKMSLIVKSKSILLECLHLHSIDPFVHSIANEILHVFYVCIIIKTQSFVNMPYFEDMK